MLNYWKPYENIIIIIIKLIVSGSAQQSGAQMNRRGEYESQ
jgi:hypothetical protein